MEAILSPLLSSGFVGRGFRKVRVLDLGCGWGRVLGSMSDFSHELKSSIQYVGCERTSEELDIHMKSFEEMTSSENITEAFDSVDFLSYDQLKAEPLFSFDVIFIVNTLHHIRPAMMVELFEIIGSLMRSGGQLFIHDLALRLSTSGKPVNEQFYCEDSIFFGPEHIRNMIGDNRNAGHYRIIPRERAGKEYWLYTYALTYNEHTEHIKENSRFNTKKNMPISLLACIDDIEHAVASSGCSSERKTRYLELLKRRRAQVVEKYRPYFEEIERWGQMDLRYRRLRMQYERRQRQFPLHRLNVYTLMDKAQRLLNMDRSWRT